MAAQPTIAFVNNAENMEIGQEEIKHSGQSVSLEGRLESLMNVEAEQEDVEIEPIRGTHRPNMAAPSTTTDKNKVDDKEIEVITLSDDDDETEQKEKTLKGTLKNSAPKDGTLKRTMDNSENIEEKRQKIEPTKFTLYGKLVEELRHHVLSYLMNNTLEKYSMCSKLSRKDSQKFLQPYCYKLEEIENYMVVKMCDVTNTQVELKKFKLSDGKCDMEEVKQYIVKRVIWYRCAPYKIVVDMKKWPTMIVNMPYIHRAIKWDITINRTMYNDFVEWTRTKTYLDRDYHRGRAYLSLRDCDNVEERVVVGPEFFRSKFISTLQKLSIYTEFQWDRDDFVKNSITNLEVTSWKDFDAIRDIVKKANGDLETAINIALCPNDDMTFNIEELFPSERFQKIERSENSWKIGRYVFVTIFEMGKSSCLRINAYKYWDDKIYNN